MAAPVDRHSDTWKHVEEWARKRVARHTDVCTTIGMSAEETERARGALAELVALLDLGSPPDRRAID